MRVALAYVLVAWIIVEAADTIFPNLGLPAWTVTLVIVLVLAGFPVALVLAWALELTPEGLRRTPPAGGIGEARSRMSGALLWAVLALGVVALGVFAVLRMGAPASGRLESRRC